MKTFKFTSLLLGLLAMLFVSCESNSEKVPPNIVFVLTDDLGFEDLSSYGSKITNTHNLDKLASEGALLNSYYSPQAVCSASRAAILTGSYPNRIGFSGALGPNSKKGINSNELLISEMLKDKGYKTAAYGKWHLGDNKKFLPTRHGFDDFYGILYSNDMWPFHAEYPDSYPDLMLYDKEIPIKILEDQSNLTKELTLKSVEFIEKNKDNPFFLYLAHPQPHVPLFASADFKGKSKNGLYSDVIQEIDYSVGAIMKALKDNNLEDNTIVVFTSDNGPWLSYGKHAGSTGIYREGKGTTWEGGQRVPCIVWYPNEIKPNTVISTPLMGIDWLPTFANVTNSNLSENKIDGKNIWEILINKTDKPPHEALFFYYHVNSLHAVRYGDWKMYFPHRYRTLSGREGRDDGIPIKYEYVNLETTELYNLIDDPSETKNIYNEFPEIAKKIEILADIKRKEIGDDLTKVNGTENRPIGMID
ncbi:MAG: arylsulfatase [Cryomorphaceae bacterium BACL29 MAG-121220-bin8]|jgi:arylsulfatase A-like enzyme|nr:MAG: arylsulfatase [Cryomorphaceae bacterium BACL29 MAG-121220-bin8]|tara:strand:- start:10093 stop:11514 length:1422 start_codon:yes stop_codon:yes gene_type:complete